MQRVTLLFTWAWREGWDVAAGDRTDAFLQGPLRSDENMFVEPQPQADLPQNVVWRLKCALLGLRSGPVAWTRWQHVTRWSFKSGCVPYPKESRHVRAARHMDDIIFTGPKQASLGTGEKPQVRARLFCAGNTAKFLGSYLEKLDSWIQAWYLR